MVIYQKSVLCFFEKCGHEPIETPWFTQLLLQESLQGLLNCWQAGRRECWGKRDESVATKCKGYLMNLEVIVMWWTELTLRSSCVFSPYWMNNNNSYENQEITILVIQKTRTRFKLFLEVKERICWLRLLQDLQMIWGFSHSAERTKEHGRRKTQKGRTKIHENNLIFSKDSPCAYRLWVNIIHDTHLLGVSFWD
jgi:hypothetical protein